VQRSLSKNEEQSAREDQAMRTASPLWWATAGIALHFTLPIDSALAQTRAECEEGIRFIRDALARVIDPNQRATLTKALRDAQRELGEEEYDECLDAVEDAFVPRPREVEVKSRFIYDRLRRRTIGEEDEGTLRNRGRNRYTPGAGGPRAAVTRLNLAQNDF
jgi:hypothetical protein